MWDILLILALVHPLFEGELAAVAVLFFHWLLYYKNFTAFNALYFLPFKSLR